MNNFIKRKLIKILSIILILPIVSFMGCNNKTARAAKNVSNAEQNKQEESKTNTEETPEYKFLKNNYSQLDLFDNDDFSTFKLLDSSIEHNDIFLAGEMHGTLATVQLKSKLLKYFKKKADIKYFLVELSYGSTVLLNDYIETGNEDILEKFFDDRFIGSEAYSKEYYDFWKNLYKFNKNLPEERKIKVIGVDKEFKPMTSLYYMNHILPEKEPPKEIASLIKELKKMYKNVSVDKKSILSFTPRLKDSIETNRSLYEEFLGDKLIDFEIMNYSLLTTYKCVEKYDDTHGNDYADINYRDEIMYDNFIKLYPLLPKGKIFGQLGGAHTANSHTSFYSLLNGQDSPIKTNILSIYYLYNDCESMSLNSGSRRYTKEKQSKDLKSIFPNDVPDDNILNPFVKSDTTLFKLTGENSPFSRELIWFYRLFKPSTGVTTDSCQFVIFIKNSRGCTPIKRTIKVNY